MTTDEFRTQMNEWGQKQVPFLFVIDFEMKKPLLLPLDKVNQDELLFDVNGVTNATGHATSGQTSLEVFPISLEAYRRKFEFVLNRLAYGDTFLANLTVKTPIQIHTSLRDLFYRSKARYKLWLHESFLVFSPEIFVQIRDGKIFSYPMKGTIDASMPDARQSILNDQKEKAEHTTIVDLIRNDLSMVSSGVHVARFRYIDSLTTTHKTLLQVSSEIVGTLPDDYAGRLGDIMTSLLPAGSVTGAPKTKTVEIIQQAEGEERGYYTGVFGYFDGKNLDSGVMIRFIEHQDNRYTYRSGGGITTQSRMEAEYQEMIDKVYVPVD